MNKRKTPAIRFKGYQNDWEQRKLSSLCEKFTDGDWIESEDQSDSGVRLIQTGNVGVTEYLDKPNNKKWISNETFDRLHCEEVLPGDILISRLPEPAGRACIMPFLGTKMITAVDCTIVRTSPDVSNKFLVQYLSSQPYFNEVNTCLAGGTRQRISRSNLSNFMVPIPSEKDEQDAIGSVFESIDNLITLHQRKLEKLKILKKTMLENCFPQKGESVPRVRFGGFTGDWEQRKFSELYEKASRKNDLTYGKYDIISVANMYFKPDSYITDERYLLTYNIFELGDIAFEGNKSKNYAHGRFVENTIGNGIVSHVFDVFKPIMKPYDLQFWKYAINNERLMGGILLRSTKASTMMTNLVANDFLQETFVVPSYPEQQKIGAFFQGLDNLITLHHRKQKRIKICYFRSI
ncbi:restriction endonuclease subunit S [Bilifractor sp. LCP19S3_H10]|uniref:restriction endonuclease subunit S n=1 Tax=Bilifractor sp. LCP19S3_H10 TaxID=3438736 RepID=UPI003F913F73